MFKNNRKQHQKWLNLVTLRSVTKLLLVLISVWIIPLSSRVKSDTLIFLSNFESGFSEWGVEACCSHSIQTVNSPVRAGEQAVRFFLQKDDPRIAGSKRTELKLGEVPANSERWYSFSVFLPADYQQDPSGEIIAQWHDLPDRDLGESWKFPALCLNTKNGRFGLFRTWDSKQVTLNNATEGQETVDLGSYQTGKWTDFVFHVKWSSRSDGRFEVWQDGKLVVSKNGPNYYNDKRGPYLKIGIYKGDWKNHPENSTVTERTLYYDEVRIGDANARYEDVAPRN